MDFLFVIKSCGFKFNKNFFINSKEKSPKHIPMIFLYESLKNLNMNCDVIENDEHINTKNIVMLSYFNEYYRDKNPMWKYRYDIVSKYKNSNLILFEANPLARYLKNDKLENRYVRVCFNYPFHKDSSYVKDNSRWDDILSKTGLKVSPWRKEGKHILFVLNSCKFCGYSMQNVDLYDWVNEKIKEIRSVNCEREIRIRFKCDFKIIKQTKNLIHFSHKNNEYKIEDTYGNLKISNTHKSELLKELKNAWACVVYSTSACVISILNGIPVFCTSKDTITYNISNTDFSKIESPLMPNRTDFFNEFSRQIWSFQEIKDGKLAELILDKLNSNNNLVVKKPNKKEIRKKKKLKIRKKKERLEKERLEKERLEKERLEKERLEKERLEQKVENKIKENVMEKKLAQYLQNKRIVIVGPASYVYDIKNGSNIDNYDVVFRIKKSFPVLQEHHDYIGKKTNVLISHLKVKCGKHNYFQNNFNSNSCKVYNNNLDFILFPYPRVKHFDRFVKNFKKDFKDITIPLVYPEDSTILNNIKNDLNGYDPKIFMASLKYLLKFDFQEIYITGITFDRDGFHESYKNKKDDDFCKSRTSKIHNSDFEMIYFKNLITKDKRIKIDSTIHNILEKI